MSTAAQIRTAMKTALDAIDMLRVYDVVPGNVSYPAAVVGLPAYIYDTSFARGVDELEVPVLVLVASMVERVAQEQMNALVSGTGPASVKGALEDDRSLGGVVHTLRVEQARPQEFQVAERTVVPGYQFTVRVWTTGA